MQSAGLVKNRIAARAVCLGVLTFRARFEGIRFGDDPRDVFRALAERVGTETFLLFASTLSTHWEVGGSLTPTLSSVPGHAPIQEARCLGDGNVAALTPTSAMICCAESTPSPGTSASRCTA